jgi:hypothetical protein
MERLLRSDEEYPPKPVDDNSWRSATCEDGDGSDGDDGWHEQCPEIITPDDEEYPPKPS